MQVSQNSIYIINFLHTGNFQGLLSSSDFFFSKLTISKIRSTTDWVRIRNRNIKTLQSEKPFM